MATVTIYMPLRNEGIDCWRPVEAEALGAETYRVNGPVPEEEEWEFPPGAIVRCRYRVFANGQGLEVVERVLS